MLNYKKPTFWVVVVALIAVVAVGIGLLSNPKDKVSLSEIDFGLGSEQLGNITSVTVNMPEGMVDITNSTEIKKVIDTIQGIKIYKKETSKDRGNRDTTNQITLFKTINGTGYENYINISNDFSEVWYDNGVKPSYSYKIADSVAVMHFMDSLYGEDFPVSYWGKSAGDVLERYLLALLSSDYERIKQLTPTAAPITDKITKAWKQIKISNVVVVEEDVMENKAEYKLSVTVDNAPDGFGIWTVGTATHHLYLENDDLGWHVASYGVTVHDE